MSIISGDLYIEIVTMTALSINNTEENLWPFITRSYLLYQSQITVGMSKCFLVLIRI
jgi:hypothetical protein